MVSFGIGALVKNLALPLAMEGGKYALKALKDHYLDKPVLKERVVDPEVLVDESAVNLIESPDISANLRDLLVDKLPAEFKANINDKSKMTKETAALIRKYLRDLDPVLQYVEENAEAIDQAIPD